MKSALKTLGSLVLGAALGGMAMHCLHLQVENTALVDAVTDAQDDGDMFPCCCDCCASCGVDPCDGCDGCDGCAAGADAPVESESVPVEPAAASEA